MKKDVTINISTANINCDSLLAMLLKEILKQLNK